MIEAGRATRLESGHQGLYGALSFVIPSEAEGSAVPRTSPGNAESRPATELSSHEPERTRISD